MKKAIFVSVVGFTMSLGMYANVSAAETGADSVPFVAGVNPDQRPVDAPVITEFNKERAWYDNAVTGLQPPFPASFSFLDYQEGWYTPFNHPGMHGKYDIRGWHRPK